MSINPLLLLAGQEIRYGIDGGTINTLRHPGYLRKTLLNQAKPYFYKFNIIPPEFKSDFGPKSKIVFSNPTKTGIDILSQNIYRLGKSYSIFKLEPYFLVFFDSLSDARSFQSKFTACLHKDRSYSTELVDSDNFVGKAIPEHCFPGETFYINSKSKKRTDVGYVSRDKLEPDKWVFKYEVGIKTKSEIKRLTGISCLSQLADLFGDPEGIKGVMEKLLKNAYHAKVDINKLARWLLPTNRQGFRSLLQANQFLRVVESMNREVKTSDGRIILLPPGFEIDAYSRFNQGLKKWQAGIKANRGRRSKFAQKLLDLNPAKFKLKSPCIDHDFRS